jgi:hypothetical protein
MTVEQHRTAVVRETDPSVPMATPVATPTGRVYDERVVASSDVAVVRPSGSTVAARVVALLFGIVQGIILLRIAFLVLNAREGNALVAAVLDLSQIFVAPFEGILRTNALQAGGSVVDLAAIVALIGWTLVELVILAIVRVKRPGEDV